MFHKIENIENIKNFLTAGNATFTIKSVKTGDHITFKVRKPKKDTPYFVSVLTGTDNDNDYRYLGCVYKTKNNHIKYFHGKKSKISMDSKSNKVFSWFVNSIEHNTEKLANQAEFYHENRCGRCGRTLTVPESIIDGLGPICKQKLHLN